MKPFDLALPKILDMLAVRPVSKLAWRAGPVELKRRYLIWLSDILSTATKRLQDALTRYKRDRNDCFRRRFTEHVVGEHILVERESAFQGKENLDPYNTRFKPAPRTAELFRVVAADKTITTSMLDGLQDRVSKFCVAKAPVMDKAN